MARIVVDVMLKPEILDPQSPSHPLKSPWLATSLATPRTPLSLMHALAW